jgi:hypothetical protein
VSAETFDVTPATGITDPILTTAVLWTVRSFWTRRGLDAWDVAG